MNGEITRDPALRIPEGATVEANESAPRERRGVLPDARILFADRSVAVVFKEAGELTVPYDDERDTLVDKLRAALRRRGKGFDPQLGIVHRLDKGTSGILVFARNLAAKRHLAGLFRSHDIERRYEALAHGHAALTSHESYLIANRGDGLRGSWGVFRKPLGKRPKDARWSRTHVLKAEPLRGASRLTLKLETGRQHQIRIHLAEAGHPLVGEHVYIRDHERAGRRTIDAPRPMLHARSLGFVHPDRDEMMRFEAPPPADFQQLLKQLRSRTDPQRDPPRT